MSKIDKKHTKGNDQPKGGVSRESRIAQAKDDEVGTCIDTCFKFVVPSSDPVPGHAARGQSTQDLGDGTCTTQYLCGKRYKT